MALFATARVPAALRGEQIFALERSGFFVRIRSGLPTWPGDSLVYRTGSRARAAMLIVLAGLSWGTAASDWMWRTVDPFSGVAVIASWTGLSGFYCVVWGVLVLRRHVVRRRRRASSASSQLRDDTLDLDRSEKGLVVDDPLEGLGERAAAEMPPGVDAVRTIALGIAGLTVLAIAAYTGTWPLPTIERVHAATEATLYTAGFVFVIRKLANGPVHAVIICGWAIFGASALIHFGLMVSPVEIWQTLTR